MRATVVIRSRNEAARLRLTLASLAGQSAPCEVVVVNDGSTDATAEVIAQADGDLDLVRIDHDTPQGRHRAASAGASRASGDLLIFLDGDTLLGPDAVKAHIEAHTRMPGIVGRGETWHLRHTRLFADPEAGTPMPGEAARVEAMSAAERERARVTRRQIAEDFAAIDRRAQPGVYAGAGPRKLYDLEMEALRLSPDCEALWAAASGSNQSFTREAFLAFGGFSEQMEINAHREIALRLCRHGLRMAPVDGARSYHLTHRRGWRDPLTEVAGWEAAMYGAHPIPEVPLLAILWGSLADAPAIPEPARITTIPGLAAAARRLDGIHGLEEVRRAHLAAAA